MHLTYFPLLPPYWRSSGYGPRTRPYTGFHRGVDYAASSGAPIYAPFDGWATVGYQAGGAGHWTNVRHASGWTFKSFHHRVAGRVGQVRAGERIAEVGSTGGSTGPHGHFELWPPGASQPIDPTAALAAAPHVPGATSEIHTGTATGDWLDMATEDQVRAWLREEVDPIVDRRIKEAEQRLNVARGDALTATAEAVQGNVVAELRAQGDLTRLEGLHVSQRDMENVVAAIRTEVLPRLADVEQGILAAVEAGLIPGGTDAKAVAQLVAGQLKIVPVEPGV